MFQVRDITRRYNTRNDAFFHRRREATEELIGILHSYLG